MIPRSSTYVFMWSPMSSLETCVFLKTGGISANFPFKWSGTFRSISKAPSIRSSITARKMVSSVILNCPAQGLCMSFTKAFTALILFLQTFPVTFPHLLHWIAIVLDVLYLLLGSLVSLFHRLAFLIRRWFAVVQMTIMSIPITSLEFVCGVCLFDVAIHWKAPTSYYFLFVVAMMSDMVSALLGFPFQPFNHHPLITSGTGSHSSAYKMSG